VAPTAEDAEDVVQEAFMSALRAIGTFDLARPFGFWLDRIVVNRALSLRRSRARKREEQLDMDVVATGEGPSEAVERGEVMDRFRAALAGLPPRQRVIVQMFEVDGLSSPEIAEMLGISDGTVRWHLHAARQVLRAALAPFAPGGTRDGT
jgi:RNA polymerase sigma-70 factor (ECF subfamily)